MKQGLTIAIVISVIVHAAAIATILMFGRPSPETAAGEKEYIVAVDMISDASSVQSEKTSGITVSRRQMADRTRDKAMKEETGPDAHSVDDESQRAASSEQRAATTGDGGTNKTLAKIKAKIERSKMYPRLAKKMGIEGRPTVVFEINSDGSIKFVRITESSGEKMIDEAAVETVKRAAPLPYYSSPIRLAIRYELR